MRFLPLLLLLSACASTNPLSPGDPVIDQPIAGERRTPAEWEPQAAVWLQWPQAWEGDGVQEAFADIVDVIAQYEDVHLLATDAATQALGEDWLSESDTARVTWHVVPNDNSWMRDNGPRYVEVDGELVLQNWEFDAWGGGFGDDIPYANDNAVPDVMAEILDLPSEHVAIVHERGDLEVNGLDTAMVSWSVLSHRNPNMTREAMTEGFQDALGVESVIYIEGFDPLDGTRGHTDGLARFVTEDTIAVVQDGSALADDVAAQIADQRPDLNLERIAFADGSKYANFLVGNGFVLSASGGDDAAWAAQLQTWFPGRDVHFVDTDALWANGGGIHCVTNDEPAR